MVIAATKTSAPKGSRNKKWNAAELRHLALAWMNATNTIKGTDQRMETFVAKIVENFQKLAPVKTPAGTYHLRGSNSIYGYLRDHVFKDCQRFNGSLRLVELAGLSGVTEQEKINIAVAIFLGRTKEPCKSYEYRNYDPTTWTYYLAWNELRRSPKFSLDVSAVSQASTKSTTSDDPVSGLSSSDDELKTEKELTLERKAARGESGRGKSKKEAQDEYLREERDKKRKARHDEVSNHLQRMVDCQRQKLVESQRSREIVTIRSALIEFADDEEIRQQLRAKLLKLVLMPAVVDDAQPASSADVESNSIDSKEDDDNNDEDDDDDNFENDEKNDTDHHADAEVERAQESSLGVLAVLAEAEATYMERSTARRINFENIKKVTADAEVARVENIENVAADAEVARVENLEQMLYAADAERKEESLRGLAARLRVVEEAFAENHCTAFFSIMSLHEKMVVGFLMEPYTQEEEQYGGKLGTEIARLIVGKNHCVTYSEILRAIEALAQKSIIYIADEDDGDNTRFGFCFTMQA
jgi:hypothetical protein